LLNHILVIGWSIVVFAVPWVKESWVFVVLFILMGLARSLSRVTSATIVAEENARNHSGIGVASGFYNMGLDMGALTGPLIAGFVARLTDIPTMMRIIPMMMVVIYFGALFWMRRASPARAITPEAEVD
jgi:MFS family permease